MYDLGLGMTLGLGLGTGLRNPGFNSTLSAGPGSSGELKLSEEEKQTPEMRRNKESADEREDRIRQECSPDRSIPMTLEDGVTLNPAWVSDRNQKQFKQERLLGTR